MTEPETSTEGTSQEPQDAAQEPQDGAEAPDDPKPAKEAAKYRRQLREAEAERDQLATQLDAIRRQTVEQMTGLVRPEALWLAGVEVDSLLAEDGRVDPERVAAAVTDAADRLGLARRNLHTPDPGQGSGHGSAPSAPSGLASAFGRR